MAKGQKAKPGIGSTMSNAKSIDTERSKSKHIGCGVADTYNANAKACNTEGKK